METNEMLTQLLGILSRETELYGAMSRVMDKEKDAAIQSDLIALSEAEIEKENILVALGLFEKQRLALITDLAESLGYSSGELNLTRISKIVGEPFAVMDCQPIYYRTGTIQNAVSAGKCVCDEI